MPVRDPGERRRLVRYALWAGGALAAAAVVLFAAFWLRYRDPDESAPRALQVLPDRPATADDAALRESGWADREAGVVHIPVDEAIAILAPGLPVREGGADFQQRSREQIPNDAGSGRPPPAPTRR